MLIHTPMMVTITINVSLYSQYKRPITKILYSVINDHHVFRPGACRPLKLPTPESDAPAQAWR